MADVSEGVPAENLSDDLLRHELLLLKNHQAEIESSGTPEQKKNHIARTAQLEAEFAVRFADDAAGPADDADTAGAS